jgi:hypothetical protein
MSLGIVFKCTNFCPPIYRNKSSTGIVVVRHWKGKVNVFSCDGASLLVTV